jgi:hypothetical protein
MLVSHSFRPSSPLRPVERAGGWGWTGAAAGGRGAPLGGPGGTAAGRAAGKGGGHDRRSRGQPFSFLVRLCNETGGVLLTQG